MKTQSLLLFLLIAFCANAQRIDQAINNQHAGKTISPIQITTIDSNLLAVVYAADSVNYITKITTDGKLIKTTQLSFVSDNQISYVKFNQTGYDIFYRHYSLGQTTRTLTRVNDSTGLVSTHVFSTEDSVGNEPYFAVGSNKLVWYNHYYNNKASMVVGHINDTGNAQLKTYSLQSHFTELSYILGSKPDQFIAYFNGKRYLLSINDSLGIDTVALNNTYDKRVVFNNKMLHTVGYNANQWSYTALLNESGDTVFSQSKFDFLRSDDDWLVTNKANNNLWITNRSSDSLAVTLFDTSYNEIFTKYINGFKVHALATSNINNELYMLGKDSHGLIIHKVNSSTLNTNLTERSFDLKMSVYPNPVEDVLNLILPVNAFKLNIYTTNGELVQSHFAQAMLYVTHLKQGLYLLVAVDKNNLKITATRIVKQ